MLESLIESIYGPVSMILFGLVLGFLFGLTTLFMPFKAESKRKPGESFIAHARRTAEESRADLRHAPRSVSVLIFSTYGVVAVLIITVIYSPVRMHWLIFIPALLFGMILVQALYGLAKRGQLRAEGYSWVEILLRPKANRNDLKS